VSQRRTAGAVHRTEGSLPEGYCGLASAVAAACEINIIRINENDKFLPYKHALPVLITGLIAA
jgi:hypothetical protein